MERGARGNRFGWSALLLIALFVFAAARWLTPSTSGVGTHEQLGLPPCGFLAAFGLPCPACGLTTAFAYLARGQVLDSLRAQPLGLPLYLLTWTIAGASVWGLARNVPLSRLLTSGRVDRAALLLTLAALVVWCVRVGLLAWS